MFTSSTGSISVFVSGTITAAAIFIRNKDENLTKTKFEMNKSARHLFLSLLPSPTTVYDEHDDDDWNQHIDKNHEVRICGDVLRRRYPSEETKAN